MQMFLDDAEILSLHESVHVRSSYVEWKRIWWIFSSNNQRDATW